MRWARCILAAGWMAALLAGCAIPGAVGRGPSHPKTAHDHYLWGEYYRRTGKFDKAIKSFTTSIALSADASNADSFLWRADCRLF